MLEWHWIKCRIEMPGLKYREVCKKVSEVRFRVNMVRVMVFNRPISWLLSSLYRCYCLLHLKSLPLPSEDSFTPTALILKLGMHCSCPLAVFTWLTACEQGCQKMTPVFMGHGLTLAFAGCVRDP